MNTFKNTQGKGKEGKNIENIEKIAKSVSGGIKPPEKVMPTIKINVIMPKTLHRKFKTYCMLEEIDMQEKACELIFKWLDSKPDLF